MTPKSRGQRILELMDQMEASRGHKIDVALRGLNWSIYNFETNYQELRQALIEVTQDPETMPLAFLQNRNLLHEAQQEISRLLHNFLAAAKSLVDHTRNITNDFYRDVERKKQLQERIDQTFTNDPLTQFIQGLRNYSLHYHLPFLGYRLSFGVGKDLKRDIGLNVETLREWGGWKAPAKRYLDGAGKRIELLPAIESYRNKTKAYYEWFGVDIRELYEEDYKELWELEREWIILTVEDAILIARSAADPPGGPDDVFVSIFASEDFEELAELADNPAERARLAIQLLAARIRDVPDELAQDIQRHYEGGESH